MPDKEELEDIKKLPPEERIKKLKELEQKRKKEIEEASNLIKASIEEVQQEEAREQITELVGRGEAKLLQSEAEKRIFESLRGRSPRQKDEELKPGKKAEALEDTIEKEDINPELLQRREGVYMRPQNLYEAITRTTRNEQMYFTQHADHEELDNYYKAAQRMREERPQRIGDDYRKTISEEIMDNAILESKVLKSMGYEMRRIY